MIRDELKYVFQHITHRRLRSSLSILSILIGITAIFALLSFGIGMQDYINNLSKEMGTDKIMIMAKTFGVPGTDPNFVITKDDIDFIAKQNGIGEIVGMYAKAGEIEFKKETAYNFLISIDSDHTKLIHEMATLKLYKGRILKNDDLGKIVLGYNYGVDKKIFEKGVKVGDNIILNGLPFEVVGMYNEIGNPQDDSQIYVTNTQFELLYPETKYKYGYAMAKTTPGANPTEIAERLAEKIRKHKGQEKGEEDFYIMSFEDTIKTFGNIIFIINGVLILIAIVSMIVAFINIMNTMYTAVIERTKEIGVMKSIGARNSFILFVFVAEAGILGLVGGFAGVIFGYIVAKIGQAIATSAGYSLLQPSFPPWLIIGCLLFAFIVGATSGYLPAKQASKLKPVDALRYE